MEARYAVFYESDKARYCGEIPLHASEFISPWDPHSMNRSPQLIYRRVPLVTLRMVRERSVPWAGQAFASARDVLDFVRPLSEDRDREVLFVLCLDVQHSLICLTEASVGTLTQAMVSPREIFKIALMSNAAAIIVAHNHPSGNPSPSHDDRVVTEKLIKAGDLMGVRLLDHIIVGSDGRYFSFAEHGDIPGTIFDLPPSEYDRKRRGPRTPEGVPQ